MAAEAAAEAAESSSTVVCFSSSAANGMFVNFRGGRDARQDKKGEQGGKQGEGSGTGRSGGVFPVIMFGPFRREGGWIVDGAGGSSRAGRPRPGWAGGSRCPLSSRKEHGGVEQHDGDPAQAGGQGHSVQPHGAR